jgi:hypothetical protein
MNTEQSCQEFLTEENWAWVDKRLEELYYGYALTVRNADEYASVGLLTERWSWVDRGLEIRYNNEEDLRILCPAPIDWINDTEKSDKNVVLEEHRNRSRAESDISDHSDIVERVLNKISPASKCFDCYLDVESDVGSEYDYLYYDCDGYDSP